MWQLADVEYMQRIVYAIVCFVAAAAMSCAGQNLPDDMQQAMALQLALDEAGFSPGLIDGKAGRKTAIALREFQQAHRLSGGGALNAATIDALRLTGRTVLATYRITAADRASVTGVTTDWLARSRMDRLGYDTLTDALAERFHCTQAMLKQLNSGINIDAAYAGQTLTVPAIVEAKPVSLHRLEVDLAQKIVRGFDSSGRVVSLMHCSIAADKTDAPRGRAEVAVVVPDPNYTFDPAKWPEVRGIDRKLLIPPGPRNPVGVCWVGLSLPGYGMHGTPWPEMIGKTGSHGCIRLTNWDAKRLGQMVRTGIEVRFR
jgi:lipoprotein-anchoring transpeptidase ErfK/SrfK